MNQIKTSSLITQYYNYKRWLLRISPWDDYYNFAGKFKKVSDELEKRESLPKKHEIFKKQIEEHEQRCSEAWEESFKELNG